MNYRGSALIVGLFFCRLPLRQLLGGTECIPKMMDFVLKIMDFVLNMMNFVLNMMNFVLNMMDFVLKMMDFVLNMMNFVLKMMDFVLNMMNFVLNMMNFGRELMSRVIVSGCCSTRYTKNDGPSTKIMDFLQNMMDLSDWFSILTREV